MSPLKVRHLIRAITDRLGLKDDPLTMTEIYDRLPEPKPSKRHGFQSMLQKMSVTGELDRVDCPDHKRSGRATTTKHAYRSGREPVADRRTLNRKPVRTGFMALARLRSEDPAAWARVTNNGKL